MLVATYQHQLKRRDGSMTPREMLWHLVAYAARHGRQPISEVMVLTRRELMEFVNAVAFIIKREAPDLDGQDD